MNHKGNCYDQTAIVDQAIEKTHWSTRDFFIHAQEFTGTKKFVPERAAEQFESQHVVPRGVGAFADWIAISPQEVIAKRFG